MGRLVEAVLPARLGTSFRWLVSSSWVSNLGDGVGLAAFPLLVASETQDPVLVSLAALLQRLPWLLFGLVAGVVADRVDRRTLVVAVDLARAVVLGVLAVAVFGGAVDIWVVLGAGFLAGIAEVFADATSTTLLPMVVERRDLGVGNARVMAGMVTMNQMVGPALGAALFAAGRGWPVLTQAVCVGLGAVLVSRMRLPARTGRAQRSHVVRDVVEAARWTWHNPPVRTLTLAIVTFNVTFGAAWSVLVLWSAQRLGLGPVGFGLLSTVSAVGGVVGTFGYDWLEAHVGLARLMRIGLVIETFTHLGLALATAPWLAMAIMFVFGAHAFVWGTTSQTIRMRAVPGDLQGRVGSLYAIGVYGGIVVGQAAGGVIARVWGVTGPFWFAFVGSGVILALIWRELRHVAHTEDPEPAPA